MARIIRFLTKSNTKLNSQIEAHYVTSILAIPLFTEKVQTHLRNKSENSINYTQIDMDKIGSNTLEKP